MNEKTINAEALDALENQVMKKLMEMSHLLSMQDVRNLCADLMETIRAAPIRPSVGWMPIESAPKDGSQIIVADRHWTETAFYADGVENYWNKSGFYAEEYRQSIFTARPLSPTHWIPLPAAPKEGE